MDPLAPWLRRRLAFFLNHFLTHFCHYPLLPAVLLLVGGLLLGKIGAGYGVPHLIYHDEWLKRSAAGLALTALTAQCLLVGYLLEFGRQKRTYQGEFPGYAAQTLASFVAGVGVIYGASEGLKWLGGYLGLIEAAGLEAVFRQKSPRLPFQPEWDAGVLAGVLAGAALAAGVLRACRRGDTPAAAPAAPADPDGPSQYVFVFWAVVAACVWYLAVSSAASNSPAPWGPLPPALVVAVSLGAALAVALWFALPRSRRALAAEIASKLRYPEPLTGHRYHTAALAHAVAATAALVALSQFSATASPVPAVMALLVAALAAYGFVSLAIRRGLTLVLAGAAVLLALAGTIPYKFRFPALATYYATPAEGKPGDPPKPAILDLARQATVDAGRQAELNKFVLKLQEKFPEARAEVDAAAKELADAAAPDRPALEAKLNARREQLRRLEYQEYKADANFTPNEKCFKSVGVYPLRDPRSGAPLELAAEDAAAGQGLALSDTRMLRPGDIRWLKPDEKPKPLVIVTVSGGGLRSAAWTLRVLQELETKLGAKGIDFPSSIRIIAGASGGMLGAAYYTATLGEPAGRAKGGDREKEMAAQYKMLAGDFLTPIVNRAVYGDIPLFLSPSPIRTDRGAVLEAAWERELRRKPPGERPDPEPDAPLKMSFHDLRAGEVEGWRPSLVFSPMLIEDGRRLLVSNLDLKWVASNDGAMLNPEESIDGIRGAAKNYSQEAFELFRLFPAAKGASGGGLPLSTAVRMSASFPFFSPAVSLPTWPRRRVVDAGYYDNYGVSIAASWLFSGRNEEWIKENVSKVVVIQIRDGVSDDQRRLAEVGADGSSPFTRSVEELCSPLEGLDNGRVGSTSFRNDGQMEQLSGFYRRTRGESPLLCQADRFLTTVTFEFPVAASLSWYLSNGEREAIDAIAAGQLPSGPGRGDDEVRQQLERAVERHAKRFDLLAKWWGAPAACADVAQGTNDVSSRKRSTSSP